MLVSLKEDKAKKLAQVMSNPTCIRILDYLANKEGTESEIAKELKIPLSTVHYNLQQLVEAKLVIVEEFHYSKKGREVNHYKLANKYIIIAPKEDESFAERLRQFIPITLMTLGVAAVLKLMQLFTGTLPSPESVSTLAESADAFAVPMAAEAVEDSSRMMKAAVMDEGLNSTFEESGDIALTQMAPEPGLEVFSEPALDVVEPSLRWWQSPMVDWFIIGALTVLLIIIFWEAVQHYRKKYGK